MRQAVRRRVVPRRAVREPGAHQADEGGDRGGQGEQGRDRG